MQLRNTTLRILRALAVIAAVYLVVFLILTVLPGDPIENRLNNPDNSYTDEEIAKIRSYFGVDKPWWIQLLLSAGKALTWDWGISLSTLRPVTEMVGSAAGTTVGLAVTSLLIAIVLASLIAVGAQFARWQWLRSFLRALPILGVSVPVFVVGLFLLQIFAFSFGWFNIVRDSGMKALVLPALTIAVPISAPIGQLLIATLDRIRRSDYAKLAHTKGLSPIAITLQHFVRPAAPPMLTLIGLIFGELLAGTVIAEIIFGLTGIGYLIERATLDQDTPVLLFVTFISACIYVVINLIIDLTHSALDPTVKKQVAHV